MSIPQRDPIAALAAELAAIGRRLDLMAAELDGLRRADVTTARPPRLPLPASPAGPALIGPVTGPGPVGPPAGPPAVPGRRPDGPPPQQPRRRRASPTERVAAIGSGRLLAWTGAAVTLLGVVLFLALAVSRGWFAPPVRIGAGAVLGVGLVGLGWWLHRRPSARVGAVAVAATGFATLQLVIVGATTIYGYLPNWVAVLASLLVAGAGLALADGWRSRWLAHGACVGTLATAPLLAYPQTSLLAGVALATSVAALPVVWRRLWADLALLTGAVSALYTTVACILYALTEALTGSPGGRITATTLALAALTVGIGTAVAAGRRLAPIPTTTLTMLAALPAVVTGVLLSAWPGAALVAGAGVALAAAAAMPWFRGPARTATIVAAGVALFVATTVALDGATLTLVILGQALVVAALGWRMRHRGAVLAAAAIAVPGLLRAVDGDASLGSLVFRGEVEPLLVLISAAGVCALVAAVAGMLTAACARISTIGRDTAAIWVTLGVIGLYGVTGLVVNLALAVDPANGFTAGHALVTVSWTVAALFLLARGIARPALRNAGMALVAAAVAKLVFFDLAALDGIARVAAFLGAGLILLAAGTRYARLVTEHQYRSDTADEVGPTPVSN